VPTSRSTARSSSTHAAASSSSPSAIRARASSSSTGARPSLRWAGHPAEQPFEHLNRLRRVAAVEREPGAAELRRDAGARLVEQARRLRGSALSPPQLGQRHARAADPGRPRAREVLDRRREQLLGLLPPSSPEVDGPVLGAAEGEHVAAPVARRELGDPVAPLVRALEVEHGGARADEHAARPRAGDRDRGVILERHRGRLVETPHPLVDLCRGDERRAVEGEAEHLQVGDAELPSELCGDGCELAGGGRVALAVRDEAVVEGEPAVLGSGVERVEQPVRPPEPAVRHRGGAVEVELVGGEPGRHAARAGGIPALAIQAVGALPQLEHSACVVEPPRRPARALAGLRRLISRERLLEARPRGVPARLVERRPAGVDVARR
jgi:hypothetical protein